MSQDRNLLQECSAKLELLSTGLNADQGDSLTLSRQGLYGLFLSLQDIKRDLDTVQESLKSSERQGQQS